MKSARPTRKCDDTALQREIRAFGIDVMNKIFSACQDALLSKQPRTCHWTRGHQHAVNWLKEQRMAVVPTDKDGGMALVSHADLAVLYDEHLNGAKYYRIDAFDIQPGSVISLMRRHFVSIEKLTGEEGLAKHMVKEARMSNWSRP